MPLFEVYNSMMMEKARAATQANNIASSPEPFSTPEDEFGELIWDNGPRKKMFREMKHNASAATTKLATGGSGEVFPVENHEFFSAKQPSTQFGLSIQDNDDTAGDNIVPWISYNPAEEEDLAGETPREDDYSAEFATEFDMNTSSFSPPTNHRSSFSLARAVGHYEYSCNGRTAKEGDMENFGREESGAAEVVRVCSRPQDLSHQHDQMNGDRRQQHNREPRGDHVVNKGLHGRINPTSPCRVPSSRGAPTHGGGGDDGLIKFSHFLRPVALSKASMEGNRVAGGKLASGHETTSGSKPLESTLVNSGNGFKCMSTTPPLTVDAKPAWKPPRQEAVMVNVGKRPDTNSKDNAGDAEHDKTSSSFAASAALSRHEGKRLSEAAEASSSFSSSGNSDCEASNHYKRRGKRKHCEQEEEEDESGFISNTKEFVGNAKHARDRGTKKHVYQRGAGTNRFRASKVHNLSERRRRDRINERMKALQKLIPNCNKQVDKASMLEEAIEYLRSLQLQLQLQVQVQMMSMGSGAFCMPQTVARCVQNFRMPTMNLPFPAMGMGFGFGMGMGIYDMNDSTDPMFPVHPVHPQQFACANSIAEAQAALTGAPAAMNPQMLGAPSQGAPLLMPRLPFSAFLDLSMKTDMASGAPCRTSDPLQPRAGPLTTAVNSEDKRGNNLHGKAVQEPN